MLLALMKALVLDAYVSYHLHHIGNSWVLVCTIAVSGRTFTGSQCSEFWQGGVAVQMTVWICNACLQGKCCCTNVSLLEESVVKALKRLSAVAADEMKTLVELLIISSDCLWIAGAHASAHASILTQLETSGSDGEGKGKMVTWLHSPV